MRKGAHSSAVKLEMQVKIKDRSQKNSLILHVVMTFSFLNKNPAHSFYAYQVKSLNLHPKTV